MLKVSGTAAFISRSRRPVSGIAKSVKIRRVCFCRSFCIITDAFFRQSSRLLFQFRTWLFCCQTITTVECFRCYWVTFLPRRLIVLKVALKILATPEHGHQTLVFKQTWRRGGILCQPIVQFYPWVLLRLRVASGRRSALMKRSFSIACFYLFGGDSV